MHLDCYSLTKTSVECRVHRGGQSLFLLQFRFLIRKFPTHVQQIYKKDDRSFPVESSRDSRKPRPRANLLVPQEEVAAESRSGDR